MPEVAILGQPAGAGNLRRSVSGGVYNPDKRTAPWKDRIADAVALELGDWDATREPIAIMARFYFVRPAGHFKKDGSLRSNVRPAPTVAPDADKLARAVLDALTGVLYADDSQVVQLHVFKHYGGQAGLVLAWDVLDAGSSSHVRGLPAEPPAGR